MKKRILIGVAIALVFLTVLVIRLPAQWITSFLPRDLECEDPAGTLWSGECGSLRLHATSFGTVTWSIAPLRLFSARLNADVSVTRPPAHAQGNVEMSTSGTITARNLVADAPFDPALIPELPENVAGKAHVDLPFLRVNNGVIEAIEGAIQVHDLARGGPDATTLGDYSLEFPHTDAPGEPIGHLRDLGGPLSIEASLKLTKEPGFVLDGVLAARPSAPPQLARDIETLGLPDSSGRRPFSIAGTF